MIIACFKDDSVHAWDAGTMEYLYHLPPPPLPPCYQLGSSPRFRAFAITEVCRQGGIIDNHDDTILDDVLYSCTHKHLGVLILLITASLEGEVLMNFPLYIILYNLILFVLCSVSGWSSNGGWG